MLELKEKKIKEFRKMKFLALALLIFALVSFLCSLYFDIPLLKAISEAALIWWIADWFAVTAIFKHPLWLKIPHTSLITRQKDNIANNLAKFIKNEFLNKENLQKYLNNIDFATKIWWYLQSDNSSKKIADIVSESVLSSSVPPMIMMFLQSIDINSFLQSRIKDLWLKLENDNWNKQELNNFLSRELLEYIFSNTDKIEYFISDTVASWDAREMSDKLELEVWKDLQFIRINWTIVWWILWAIIYFFTTLFV